jgi:hypothetical protein
MKALFWMLLASSCAATGCVHTPQSRSPVSVTVENGDEDSVPEEPTVGPGSPGIIAAAATVAAAGAVVALRAQGRAQEWQRRAEAVFESPDAAFRDDEYRYLLARRDDERGEAIAWGVASAVGAAGAAALAFVPRREGSSGDVGVGLSKLGSAGGLALSGGYGGFVVPRVEVRVGGTASLGLIVFGTLGPTANVWLTKEVWVGGGAVVGGGCSFYGCGGIGGAPSIRAGFVSGSFMLSIETIPDSEIPSTFFVVSSRQGYSFGRHQEKRQKYRDALEEKQRRQQARNSMVEAIGAARAGDCTVHERVSAMIKASPHAKVYSRDPSILKCVQDAARRVEELEREVAAAANARADCAARREATFARASAAEDPVERAAGLDALENCGDVNDTAWGWIRDAARLADANNCAAVQSYASRLESVAAVLRDGAFAKHPRIAQCLATVGTQPNEEKVDARAACLARRRQLLESMRTAPDAATRARLADAMPICEP